MEFYDSSHITDLSVHDVFESEVQTEMEQILSSEAARFTPHSENGDVIELSCVDGGVGNDVWDSTVTLPGNTLAGTTSTLTTTSTANSNTSFSTDFSHLTSPDKYGLDGSSLLVDPQTGLPVNTLQLHGHNATQQLNLIVSAADSTGQTIQQQIPVSLNLGNINMNLSSHHHGLYTQSALLTVNADTTQQQQQSTLGSRLLQQQSATSQQQQQQITFQNAAATLQGLQAAFAQVPLQNQNMQTQQHANAKHKVELESKNFIEKVWSKPAYSYSCLITMALKNSKLGYLPVSEIYQFMCENFPYFKTAPDGWKNSVRHNLSLNKCFAKIEKPASSNSGTRKGCLWALNPEKTTKMEEEVVKWTKKDPAGIRRAMAHPDELEKIEAAVVGVYHTPHIQLQVTPTTRIEPKPRVRTPPAPVLAHVITRPQAIKLEPRPQQAIKLEPKISISDDFASNTHMTMTTPDLFGSVGGDINMMEPGAVAFEGDFNLQVYADQLGLDPLTCGDFMNFDIPMTTSGLPSNPVMSSFLDASPIKDVTLGGLHGLDPQQYAQSQFCSPSRTSVSALM